MTRVDFYILSRDEADLRLSTACRLADKAFRLGHRVFIHAASGEEAQKLDRLLWTFRDDSFVPHSLAGDGSDPDDPVRIGAGPAPDPPPGVLINLAGNVPSRVGGSMRIAEIVGADPAGRAAGRERYRRYRDQGFALTLHRL